MTGVSANPPRGETWQPVVPKPKNLLLQAQDKLSSFPLPLQGLRGAQHHHVKQGGTVQAAREPGSGFWDSPTGCHRSHSTCQWEEGNA